MFSAALASSPHDSRLVCELFACFQRQINLKNVYSEVKNRFFFSTRSQSVSFLFSPLADGIFVHFLHSRSQAAAFISASEVIYRRERRECDGPCPREDSFSDKDNRVHFGVFAEMHEKSKQSLFLAFEGG